MTSKEIRKLENKASKNAYKYQQLRLLFQTLMPQASWNEKKLAKFYEDNIEEVMELYMDNLIKLSQILSIQDEYSTSHYSGTQKTKFIRGMTMLYRQLFDTKNNHFLYSSLEEKIIEHKNYTKTKKQKDV